MAASSVFFLSLMSLCACDPGTGQHGLTFDSIHCSTNVNSAYAKYKSPDWLEVSSSWRLEYINNIKNYSAGTPSQKYDYKATFDGVSETEVKETLAEAGYYAKDIHVEKKVNQSINAENVYGKKKGNQSIDAKYVYGEKKDNQSIDNASGVSGVVSDKDERAKDETKNDSQYPLINEKLDLMKELELMTKYFHGENAESILVNLRGIFEEEPDIEGNKDDEFPQSTRRKPGTVGDVTVLELPNGETRNIVTLSIRPPIFEIDNFLSDEECDYIIEKSLAHGMGKAGTFKDKRSVEQKENFGDDRVSDACNLAEKDMGKQFTEALHEKVSRLIDMPMWVVAASEPLDVKRYQTGGHYHAHLDSNTASIQQSCCFQQKCLNADGKDMMNADCCKCCRYATTLYYLNDVEEGGETVFPFADLSFSQFSQRSGVDGWRNLSIHCHDAAVVVKPKKGKAIFWYNNFLDKHGYLGGVDQRSYHGGCDVTKGNKWIATNWIAAPNYLRRFQRSKFLDNYTYLKD